MKFLISSQKLPLQKKLPKYILYPVKIIMKLEQKPTKSIQKLPDGPSMSSWEQQLHSWKFFFDPISTLEERFSQYGDIFRTNKNSTFPYIYCGHPDAVQQIINADADIFDSREKHPVIREIMGKHSMSFLDGKPHLRQRKLLMPPLHGDRMHTYGQSIHDITSEVIAQWKINKPFCIRKSIEEITSRVIFSVVFGLNSQNYGRLGQLLLQFVHSFSNPLNSSFLFFDFLQKDLGAWSPWGRFIRNQQEINQLLLGEIQKAREEVTHRDDILSLLLEARDETGQTMSDEEIKDQLMLMMIAGYENVSSTLVWALYWIDIIPSVRQKLLNELGTIPISSKQTEIVNLPYLTAVCQETLRIYPIAIAAIPRQVKKPVEIMGYQLEPGTVLRVGIYHIHQREDIYPQAKQFKPERFLERKFSPSEYLPFGFGDRFCLGYAFAMFQIKIVLATIMTQCELKLVPGQRIKPVLRSFTMAPPANMQMVVKHKVSS